jgi:hypothetical protein
VGPPAHADGDALGRNAGWPVSVPERLHAKADVALRQAADAEER